MTCSARRPPINPINEAEAPVQYGPRIAVIIVYLFAGQFLPVERTAQALAELFGILLSSGTVAGIAARAGRLDGFLESAREGISAAQVAGFDETGLRVDGRLHWMHARGRSARTATPWIGRAGCPGLLVPIRDSGRSARSGALMRKHVDLDIMLAVLAQALLAALRARPPGSAVPVMAQWTVTESYIYAPPLLR
jgi:hypothetical protein